MWTEPDRRNGWRRPDSARQCRPWRVRATASHSCASLSIRTSTGSRQGGPVSPYSCRAFSKQRRVSRQTVAGWRSLPCVRPTPSESGQPPPTGRARSRRHLVQGSSRARPGGRPTDGGSHLMRSPTIGTRTSGPWTSMLARRGRSRPIPVIRTSRTGPATGDGSTSPRIAGPGETSGVCRLQGGLSQPVTRGGSGQFACESPDGQSLLYQRSDADSPLLAVPINGGAARPLVGCVKPSAFAAGPDGVYYVACDPGPDPALHVMDPATGRDRLLGRLEKYEYLFGPLGLAVSPDGNSVLYPRRIRDSFDLMVIENFR